MIIDAGHRNWFIGTVLAAIGTIGLYVWCDRTTIGGLTGGTTAGLWFGIIGTLLMVIVGLLSALRKVPGWSWLGSRKAWMKAHIWLGLLSVVVILAHSGFRFGGGLEKCLWIVLTAIVVSGIIGLVLQQVLPAVITRRVPEEVTFEQLPHYGDVLRSRADSFADAIAVFLSSEGPDATATVFAESYDDQIRPVFEIKARPTPLADEDNVANWFGRLRERLQLPANPNAESEVNRVLSDLGEHAAADKKKEIDGLKTQFAKLMAAEEPEQLVGLAKSSGNNLHTIAGALGAASRAVGIERLCAAIWLNRLEELCQARSRFRFQERLHWWLHGWLLVHVPLSAALLALTIAHIIMSLYY